MATPALRCAVCGASGTNLSRCSVCRTTAYCSREHQVSHWKAGHKQECPRLAAATSATSASAATSAQLPQQRPAAVASGRPPVAAPATEAEVAAAVEAFERFARSLQREAGGEDDDSRRAFVIRDEVEGKGRAAFAVRDIAQGEEPFEEEAYAFAPSCRTLRRRDVCHHCFKAMAPGPAAAAARCNKCHTIAFCSPACRAEGEVLHRVECFYVKKLGHLIVNLEILLLLRIVIARWLETLSSQKRGVEGTPVFDRMMHMQAHAESQIDLLQTYAPAVEDMLRVLPAEMKVAKEAMLIIVCICSVNQFAVGRPPAENESGEGQSKDGEGSGLFLTSAIVSHSCRENAMHRTKGRRLAMLALEPIAAGSEITWSYLGNPLLPTQIRQRELYQTKVFLCQCERCLDLTECHLRAFACKACNEGLLVPLPLTQAGIETEEDRWRCDNAACGRAAGFARDVERLEAGLVRRFEEAHAALGATQDLAAALQQLEAVIADHAGPVMHPHHYLLLQIYLLHGELLRRKLDGRLPPLQAAGGGGGAGLSMNEDQRAAIRKQVEAGLRLAERLEAVADALLPGRHPLKADLFEGKAVLLARLRQLTIGGGRAEEEKGVSAQLAEAERRAADNRRLFPDL